ncbi:MAG: hypothetical protein JXR83_16930 [Deltaproteobacteria bacterium]|nr:hypothetical protein [Deltaproteobacteria bacterium]
MRTIRHSIAVVLAGTVLGLVAAPAARAVEGAPPQEGGPSALAPPVAPDAPALAEDETPAHKSVWLFWLVTGVGLASLAEGGAFFVDWAVLVQPALESARSAYRNPDVVCPVGSGTVKQCFVDQIKRMETARIADLSVGSFFALVGAGAIAGALAFLYPYGE